VSEHRCTLHVYLPALHEAIHEHRFSVLVLLVASVRFPFLPWKMAVSVSRKYVPTYDIDIIIGGTFNSFPPTAFPEVFFSLWSHKTYPNFGMLGYKLPPKLISAILIMQE